MTAEKKRAPRNRTIELNQDEIKTFRASLISAKNISGIDSIKNKTVCGDTFKILKLLPENSFDLLFADPPYNLTKNFGENSFKQIASDEYENWLDSWLKDCVRLLKPTASVYICGD